MKIKVIPSRTGLETIAILFLSTPTVQRMCQFARIVRYSQ